MFTCSAINVGNRFALLKVGIKFIYAMAISVRWNDEKKTIFTYSNSTWLMLNVENRYVQKLPKIRVIESWNKVCTMTVIEVKDENDRSFEREGERKKGKEFGREQMQVLWRDWCVLRNCSATDVRIERGKRRAADGHDHVEVGRRAGLTGDLRLGPRIGGNGCHDPAAAGKLAAPCGPQARAQRGPGPPLLPGKVRSHGSDR